MSPATAFPQYAVRLSRAAQVLCLLLVALPAAVSADIVTGLEARYVCAGNLNDTSGNGRHLSVANGVIAFAPDPTEGYACVFDGATRLKTADGVLPESAEGTYAFWINTANVTSQTLVMQTVNGATTSNTVNSIDLEVGVLRIWGLNPTFPFTFSGSPFSPNSTWRHVVITTTGLTSSVNVYIDGVPVATTLTGVDSITDLRSTFWMGGRSDLATFGLNGSLGDVRLYSRALTAADAAELFAAGLPAAGSAPPAVAGPAVIPAAGGLGLLLLFAAVGLLGALRIRGS